MTECLDNSGTYVYGQRGATGLALQKRPDILLGSVLVTHPFPGGGALIPDLSRLHGKSSKGSNKFGREEGAPP